MTHKSEVAVTRNAVIIWADAPPLDSWGCLIELICPSGQ